MRCLMPVAQSFSCCISVVLMQQQRTSYPLFAVSCGGGGIQNPGTRTWQCWLRRSTVGTRASAASSAATSASGCGSASSSMLGGSTWQPCAEWMVVCAVQPGTAGCVQPYVINTSPVRTTSSIHLFPVSHCKGKSYTIHTPQYAHQNVAIYMILLLVRHCLIKVTPTCLGHAADVRGHDEQPGSGRLHQRDAEGLRQ